MTIAATGAANTPVDRAGDLEGDASCNHDHTVLADVQLHNRRHGSGGTERLNHQQGFALSYTVSASGGTWLAVTPASGTTPGSVSVSVNTTGLEAGTYSGSVTITSSGASNSPRTVQVTLAVT